MRKQPLRGGARPRKRRFSVHIATIRVDESTAAERAGAIKAWLDRRRIKPLTFTVVEDGNGVAVSIGFASRKDARMFAEEHGAEMASGR